MPLESLSDLYLEELKDLYSAEKQILKALPKMIKAATHPELKKAFTDHLAQTENHVTRLEQICADLGASPKGKKCNGMEGVIEEGAELISEKPEANVLDAGLAGAAQHVEHYEMAGYGCVRTWAEQLGHDKHVKLLQQTLDEEIAADELLTEIAQSALNLDAETDTSDEEGPADMPRRKRTTAAKKTTRSRSDRAELR
jgi:ferritin-like metal-binding protein YciE